MLACLAISPGCNRSSNFAPSMTLGVVLQMLLAATRNFLMQLLWAASLMPSGPVAQVRALQGRAELSIARLPALRGSECRASVLLACPHEGTRRLVAREEGTELSLTVFGDLFVAADGTGG
jgi:hypothetical protein